MRIKLDRSDRCLVSIYSNFRCIYMIIMIIYARLIGAGFVLEDPALPSECSAASTCRHCPTGSSILGWWGFEQRSSNWPSSIQCLRMLRNLQIYGGHDPHHWAMLCSCVSGVPFRIHHPSSSRPQVIWSLENRKCPLYVYFNEGFITTGQIWINGGSMAFAEDFPLAWFITTGHKEPSNTFHQHECCNQPNWGQIRSILSRQKKHRLDAFQSSRHRKTQLGARLGMISSSSSRTKKRSLESAYQQTQSLIGHLGWKAS